MDIKIKKENRKDRKLDIPTFKDSQEIEEELNKVEFKDHKVKTEDTVKLAREQDELDLSTKEITTSLSDEQFDTLQVSENDLEDGVFEQKKRIETFDRDANTIEMVDEIRDQDTIKISKPEETIEEQEVKVDKSKKTDYILLLKKKLNKIDRRKALYGLLALLVIITALIGIKYFANRYDEAEYVEEQLESAINIDSVSVYGEAINFNSENDISEIELYNRENQEFTEYEYGQTVDTAFNPQTVEVGSYLVYADDKLMTIDENPKITFTTIVRDDARKDITVTSTEQNVVTLDVTNSSSDDLDILIDASQGALDGNLGYDQTMTEEKLSLEYTQKLQEKLEALGYNVAVTRNSGEEPGDCDYQDPYCAGGRVAQAYETGAKLYISIGFNGSDASGYEVNDSVYNSHELSQAIISSLNANLSSSSRASDQTSDGLYNKVYSEDGTNYDYLYLIRETGGISIPSDNDDAKDYNKQAVGAQTLVLNLGYIGIEEDFNTLTNETNIDKIVDGIANAIDSYVKQ